MPSEHRLHPYSILFAFLTQIRFFVVPGIFLMLGVGRRDGDVWEPWMMLLIIPAGGLSVLRYLTYRYRHEGSELVIRTGLLFRRERHIPYARIQNIDAVQNVLHRLLNVVELKIETGGGARAEATMSVLPTAALHEMRERVFADRRPDSSAARAVATSEAAPAAPPAPLLHLNPRELMLCGFIENRGAVLIAAAFGVIWEFGVFDRIAGGVFGPEAGGRGAIRDFARSVFASGGIAWDRIGWTIAAFIGLLLVIRLLSMVWAVIRLHGFRLTLLDGDARSEYGLLTHVTTTIPLRRVQSLTVRETPLHRRFKRVAVRVDTAGGKVDENSGQSERESLAPLLGRDRLDGFVRTIVGTGVDQVVWHPPAPGAFRREIKGWLFIASLLSTLAIFWGGWQAAPIVPLLIVWAVVAARQTIRHLGWAEADDSILFKRGWLWRSIVIVRFAKIQAVTRRESPFDRRYRMAALHVDAAGASTGSVVAIPYLARSTAETLQMRLATAAAGTQFKW